MITRTLTSVAGLGLASLLFVSTAFAGESASTSGYGKAPAYGTGAAMPASTDSDFPLYGGVSLGYETHYMFRGVNLGENAPWGEIDLNYDLTETLSLNFGAWYINPTSDVGGINPTDELDVYGFLIFPIGDLSVSVGMTAFFFPEVDGDSQEYGIALGYPIGDLFDLGFEYWADANAKGPDAFGHYFELNGSKSIELSDVIALNLGTGVGFGENYFGVSGWNHVFALGGLSFALTDTAALDLYVGGNWPVGDLKDFGEKDRVHGGASISVSF